MVILTDFLTKIANKIREVTGITEKIVANDFPNYLKQNENGLTAPSITVDETNYKIITSYSPGTKETNSYTLQGTTSNKNISLTHNSFTNLVPGNIKENETVLGITGTFTGGLNDLGSYPAETLTLTIKNTTVSDYSIVYINYYEPNASAPSSKKYQPKSGETITDTFQFIAREYIVISGNVSPEKIKATYTTFVTGDLDSAGETIVTATPKEYLYYDFLPYSLGKDAIVNITI